MADSTQRIPSTLWQQSPEIASLSAAAALVYLAARFVALDRGEVVYDDTHTKPRDVLLPGSELTVNALWPYVPRALTREQVDAGLAELSACGALSPVAGSVLFTGLGEENSARFLDRERKRETRQRDRKVSAGQEKTTQDKRAAAIPHTRVASFLAWFARRYEEVLGAPYVPEATKDRACARRLLGTLDHRDLAARTERFLCCEDEWIDRVGRTVAQLSANINKPAVIGGQRHAEQRTRSGRSIDAISRAFDEGHGGHGVGSAG